MFAYAPEINITTLCPDALYTDYTRGINRSYNVVHALHFLGSGSIGWFLGILKGSGVGCQKVCREIGFRGRVWPQHETE